MTYKNDPTYVKADNKVKEAMSEYNAAADALSEADTPSTWSQFNVARFNVAMAKSERTRARQEAQ